MKTLGFCSPFSQFEIDEVFDPEIKFVAIVYKGLTKTDMHCLPKRKYVVITTSTQ